jgi:hypothetical protein
VLTALTAAARPVWADPPPPPTFQQAVQQAYDIILNAAPDDQTPAVRATTILEAASGQSQQEILADLLRRPADYADARERLAVLMTALDQPARTTDPVVASHRLRGVLAMSRYDPLHRPPTVVERFGHWIQDRLADLVRLITGGRLGTGVPGLFFYVVGLATIVIVAVVFFRSTRGRFSEELRAASHAGPRPPADYFAEADRLAAVGDRVGAIRALCAGVAATLAGERTWEGSPLTVREIFQRAPDADGLRLLLAPFEAAIYGGRAVDEETYRGAAQVAAPYRVPAQAAA